MLVVEKEKYNMAIYEAKQELHVQILGFIRDDVVDEYLADLTATTKRISKNMYTLVVDATYQAPVPRKVSANLGATMMTYGTLGFNKIFIVMPVSKIAYVQIRNGLEPYNFPGKIYDTLAEFEARQR